MIAASRPDNLRATVAEALVTAAAAASVLLLGLPLWAMFVAGSASTREARPSATGC